jgi:hypothetical protein
MRGAAARGRRAALIFAVCWAIPGAGFCALAFQDGFVAGQPFGTDPAWTAGPAGAVLVGAGSVYAIFWLSLPVVLLIVGTGQLVATTPTGWRWPAIWATAAAAGIALDPFCLWANATTYTGDSFQWTWLTAAVGYLAIGAAMAAILIAAPRSRPAASPATDSVR